MALFDAFKRNDNSSTRLSALTGGSLFLGIVGDQQRDNHPLNRSSGGSAGPSQFEDVTGKFSAFEISRLIAQGQNQVTTNRLDIPDKMEGFGSKFQAVPANIGEALIASFTNRRSEVLRRRAQPGQSALNLSGR